MNRIEFVEQFEREARRLRLDPLRIGALAASADIEDWQTALLTRMQALSPGATWADVFPGMAPEAFAPRTDDPKWIREVDANPYQFWREQDERRAISQELDRVIPEEQRVTTVQGASWGITWPHGAAHALRAMRSLPDGAGMKALMVALERTSTEPT